MAWNEPGNNNGKDPWGNGGKNQGPPDLDEALKKGLDKLNKMLGGNGKKRGGEPGSGNSDGNGAAIGGLVTMVLIVIVIALGFMM